ncbi:MAG TPA: GGDEF domain-containing protein, partial [Janthinobacterium sp.]|nr:GGDEF domain-containing protein [Janthinobacterium sp.]
DIKTLVFALALGNLSLCAALFFFEYESKRPLSLSTWAIAKQCQAAAWLLVYLRGVVPDLMSVALANALLFAGVALDAGALWEAAGRSRWRRYTMAPLAAAVALALPLYLADLAPGLRSAAGALVVSVFFLAGAAALVPRWPEASMLRRFLAMAMTLLAAALAARGLLAVAMPGGWSWLSPDLMREAGLGAIYLMMLTNAFGFLLLSREKLQRELTRLEVVDALTDVPNRRGFYHALAPWMALARRPGMPTAMIILNLDHFKRVNDNYGHPVGDAVLKATVDVCRKQLRDSDLMGRLGGAEFAVQLPRTTLDDALMVAERIRAAVEQLPVKTERAVINLTASLGVTTIRAEDSTVSLFKRADEALQAAKEGGRNRVAAAAAAAALET